MIRRPYWNFFQYASLAIYLLTSLPLYASEDSPLNFRTIADNFNNYNGKELSMRLRFKMFDNVFDKITFYDDNNTDITFDTAKISKNSEFINDLRNAHQGLYYNVTFKPESVDNEKRISGQLITFKSLVLDSLPPE